MLNAMAFPTHSESDLSQRSDYSPYHHSLKAPLQKQQAPTEVHLYFCICSVAVSGVDILDQICPSGQITRHIITRLKLRYRNNRHLLRYICTFVFVVAVSGVDILDQICPSGQITRHIITRLKLHYRNNRHLLRYICTFVFVVAVSGVDILDQICPSGQITRHIITHLKLRYRNNRHLLRYICTFVFVVAVSGVDILQRSELSQRSDYSPYHHLLKAPLQKQQAPTEVHLYFCICCCL